MRAQNLVAALMALLALIAAPAKSDTVDYSTVGNVQTATFNHGGITVTGSNTLNIFTFNGIAVLGGISDVTIDSTESVSWAFNTGAAINVSYDVVAAHNSGDCPPLPDNRVGDRVLEAFDVSGSSLGTAFQSGVDPFFPVSGQFGNVPISRFTLTSPGCDNFRVIRVHFTPIDPNARILSCVGFDAPLNDGPVKVRGKNRVLRANAQLIDENNQPIDDLGISAAPVVQVTYSSGVSPAQDVTSDALPAGAGSEGNQFEFLGSGWLFNLSTKNFTAVGTYTVTMLTGDGSDYFVHPTCTAQFVIQ